MGVIFFLLWIILIALSEGYPGEYYWLITIAIISSYLILKLTLITINKVSTLRYKAKEYDKYYNERVSLYNEKKLLEESKINFEAYTKVARGDLEEEQKRFEYYKKEQIENINQLVKEKSSGFPWLAKAYADYFYLQNLKQAKHLKHKSHPAPVAAKKVREIAEERRTIEQKLRIAQNIISYYHDLFPFLEEFQDEVDEEILRKVLSRNIEKPIKEIAEIGVDPVKIYLSKEEYQELSTTERNQLALDRYWERPKSKWEIGRDYERYIGYLHEINCFGVHYQGILEGFDDLGRDLICKIGELTIIIQCKRWSQHKTIHEKHVNQLYGTVSKYKFEHPKERTSAKLYTTTKVSDRAKEFAKSLGISVIENFPYQQYPAIKCNVSRRTGEKIYHLPFDQQYDRTLIEEERNECYVTTVKEAEDRGFRRAWKWKGSQG